MIRIDEKRIEEILDRWPSIRRNLSEVVSSRRLEEMGQPPPDFSRGPVKLRPGLTRLSHIGE